MVGEVAGSSQQPVPDYKASTARFLKVNTFVQR